MRIIPLICSILFSAQVCMAGSSQEFLTKKRVLSDLETIRHIFEVKYAPLKWKGEFADWDLDFEAEVAKTKVMSLAQPTLKECQVILRDFFNSMKDYHVGVRFHSTEAAALPFLVKKASDNRYFVTYVYDTDEIEGDFPLEVGDEILTFDGRAIDELVQELRVKEYGENTLETDQALAEMTLTHRRGDHGNVIPCGDVSLTILKKGAVKPLSFTLTWAYYPEKIKDFSHLGYKNTAFSLAANYEQEMPLKKHAFFNKSMLAHFWDAASLAHGSLNSHALGSRTSFLPPLGKKIWRSGDDAIFDAYIFRTTAGKNIGYIRLPHYIGDEEEVEEFGQILKTFQKKTDALVIDQLNNPGGSVFYLYGLASILATKPLATPKHHIALTQDEVSMALHLLSHLEQVRNDREARQLFGETLGGYTIDFEFVQLTKQFCHFLIKEWNSGKLYTDPTHLFGVDKVKPHPHYQYSKPILLLINSLDFSAGDFFPAILQDNKRATLFGTRTAGAGGYVMSNSFPNHSGVRVFLLTGSLAERINSEPIENLGVKADIPYALTSKDLQENYCDYLNAIREAIDSLVLKN